MWCLDRMIRPFNADTECALQSFPNMFNAMLLIKVRHCAQQERVVQSVPDVFVDDLYLPQQ